MKVFTVMALIVLAMTSAATADQASEQCKKAYPMFLTRFGQLLEPNCAKRAVHKTAAEYSKDARKLVGTESASSLEGQCVDFCNSKTMKGKTEDCAGSFGVFKTVQIFAELKPDELCKEFEK